MNYDEEIIKERQNNWPRVEKIAGGLLDFYRKNCSSTEEVHSWLNIFTYFLLSHYKKVSLIGGRI